MTPDLLHTKLIQACENSNLEEVKHYLDAGAAPNFNIKSPINALHTAIQRDNYQMINLLLEHGAIVKAFVLQKAIERDKNYLYLLIPHFTDCNDETLLMGVLQAAIKRADLALAIQAIDQGAKPALLLLSDIRDLDSPEIWEVLLENGFNIHMNANKIFNQWMGESPSGGWRTSRPPKLDLLAFVSGYYLEQPKEIAKLTSSILDKIRLFRLGLNSNNFIMMKFAVLIGMDKNQALNAVLHQYYADKEKKVDYEIIVYLLSLNIEFTKVTISNAVCFQYTELLNALNRMEDLAYGYEMAYSYGNNDLCEYFSNQGVSKKAQSVAKMRVAAIKGDIKALRKAVNEGADVAVIDKDIIVQILNANQVASLKYLYDVGLVFESSLNQNLEHAMNYHKAYESITYLIEIGLDITSIKTIPLAYQHRYPALTDMWVKRFSNIFHYTIYLAREVYPKVEGKEKEEILKRVAAFSALPYVRKKSEEKSRG